MGQATAALLNQHSTPCTAHHRRADGPGTTFRIPNLDQLYGCPEYGATFKEINDAGILVCGIRSGRGVAPDRYAATAFKQDGSMVLIVKFINQCPIE